MAKFRRKAKKSRGFFKSAGRRMNKATSSTKLFQIDAMAYGALREKISAMVAPLTAKIPAGKYADNLVMGGIAYLVAKKTSGFLKNIASKGLVIENALVGSEVVKGGLLGAVGTTNNSSLWTGGY